MSSTGFGPYAAGVGYGLEALGSIAQGIAAAKRTKAVAQYNAEVLQVNAEAQAQAAEVEAQQYLRQATIADQDALLLQQGQTYREARWREQRERMLGETRSIVASSGLMLTGSPLRVYEETIRQHQLDLLVQRYQTDLAMRAAGERGVQARYAAAMARYGGSERLRIGRQQVGLVEAGTDTSQVLAGLLQASGAVAKGGAAVQLAQERRQSTSLLGGS